MEALDFETRRAYELVVRASDNGRPRALSSSALVRVLVEDANDEPPVIELVDLSTSAAASSSDPQSAISASEREASARRTAFGMGSRGGGGAGVLWAQDARRLEIFENEPAGTWLAGVLVTDADAEAPQSLHCWLEARLSPNAFDLRPIDQSQPQSQTQAQTAGGGDQSSRRGDRRPPNAKRKRRKRSVTERKPSQSQSLSQSQSSIQNEQQQQQQHQRRRLYALVTNASFDRERESLFADSIRCSDRGAPALESTLAFNVLVRDRNDNPPRFREPVMRLSVRENNAPDELVGQLLALDEDADAAEIEAQQPRTHYFLEPVPEQLNTSAAIALVSQNSNQNFNFSAHQSSSTRGSNALGGQGDVRVERDTGRLVAAALLDRERRSEYRFFAVARDAAAPALSSRALLLVEVLDENDNSVH